MTETQADDIHRERPEEENPDAEDFLNAPWLSEVWEDDNEFVNRRDTIKTEQDISIEEEAK